MFNLLLKTLDLLEEKNRSLPILIFFFILLSLLEVIGLGIIAPYIDILLNGKESFVFQYNIFNKFLYLSHKELIIYIGILIISVFFIRTIAAIFIQWNVIRFSQRQQVYLKIMLSKKMLSNSLDYLENSKRAEFVQNIHTLTNTFSTSVLFPILRTMGDAIIVFSLLVFLSITSPVSLIIIIGIFSLLLFLYDFFFKKILQSAGRNSNSAAENLISYIAGLYSGFKEMKVYNKEDKFLDRIQIQSELYSKNFSISLLLSTLPRFILEFVMVLSVISLFIALILMGYSIEKTIATASVFAVAAIRIVPIISITIASISTVRFGSDSVNRLHDNFDIKMKNSSFKNNNESINLKNMSIRSGFFKYTNGDDYVLKDINLSFKKNEAVGIIGESGSGKSTLLSIILGIRSLSNGEILVNEKSLSNTQENWISSIAFLPQEFYIFEGSIKDNVCLTFDSKYKKNDLIEVLNKVGLNKLAKTEEDLINLPIVENGLNLSGGQKQRLGISRLLYHKRKILIFDELTSALDEENEIKVFNYLNELKNEFTIVIVSHKKDLIYKLCDKIYLLENGTSKLINRNE